MSAIRLAKCLVLLLIMIIVSEQKIFAAEQYLSKIYCAVLGKNDAAGVYQSIVHEALQAFGVKDFEQVPIKKMANLTKKVVGDGVVSFTMQGIWIDEDLLAECPFEEVVFTLYLEAAHYAFRDHAKEVLLLIPASILFCVVPQIAAAIVNKEYRFLRMGYIGFMSLATLGLIDRMLMCPAVRHFDRTAEQEAARTLCRLGKHGIVQAHIDYLRSLINEGERETGAWWDSLADRVTYVTQCLHDFAND